MNGGVKESETPCEIPVFRIVFPAFGDFMNSDYKENGAGRVLLADSDKDYRVALAAQIDQHGYTVDVAASVDEMLELAAKHCPDIFVLDVLNDDTAFQLVESLKELYPDVPVIILTDVASLPAAMNALRLNLFDYIKKDEIEIRLLRRVKQGVERRELLRKLHAGEERYRNLMRRHESVREESRRRISMDLHDEIGQIFTALKIDLATINEMCTCKENVKEKFARMQDLIIEGIRQVHSLCHQLRPGALDDLGLDEAIEGLVREWSGRNNVQCSATVDLLEEIERDDIKTAVFRIIQEALTNAFRHSNATEVNIQLVSDDESATFSVSDNGKGFSPDIGHTNSYGLLNMIDRAEALGGTLEITSAPETGTMVEGRIPLK